MKKMNIYNDKSLNKNVSIKKLVLHDLGQVEGHSLEKSYSEEKVVEDNICQKDKDQKFNTSTKFVDIELIKKTSYEEGYMKAKETLQPLIDKSMKDLEFSTELINKLKSVDFDNKAAQHLFEMTSKILRYISEKLFIKLPSDFNKVLTTQLMELVKNNYQSGIVEITVHKSKLDICRDIIKLDNWPKHLTSSIVVIESETIHENASIVKWQDTMLNYNPKVVFNQIDKLLNNLISQV